MLLFRKDCRKPRAILRRRFFPGFGGFLAETGACARAAEFAEPAGPACSFVLWERRGSPKKSMKSRLSALGPCFASGDPNEFHLDKLRASVSDIPIGISCKRSSFAGKGQLRARE